MCDRGEIENISYDGLLYFNDRKKYLHANALLNLSRYAWLKFLSECLHVPYPLFKKILHVKFLKWYDEEDYLE